MSRRIPSFRTSSQVCMPRSLSWRTSSFRACFSRSNLSSRSCLSRSALKSALLYAFISRFVSARSRFVSSRSCSWCWNCAMRRFTSASAAHISKGGKAGADWLPLNSARCWSLQMFPISERSPGKRGEVERTSPVGSWIGSPSGPPWWSRRPWRITWSQKS